MNERGARRRAGSAAERVLRRSGGITGGRRQAARLAAWGWRSVTGEWDASGPRREVIHSQKAGH